MQTLQQQQQQTTRVLAIGDPHLRVDHLQEAEEYIAKMVTLVREHQPDFVVLLGDVLHCHERLHTSALNRAYQLIQDISALCPVFVLVGNHDYINNSQFLTEHHWMNAMKQWPQVTVVDKVHTVVWHERLFVFCPYVYPGRFKEALNTVFNWTDGALIFCHQEFKGCKMGAIVSEEGDEWETTAPMVVSGHVHDKQWVGQNVYYTGSSAQHAFGESHDKTVALITLSESDHIPVHIEEIPTRLTSKQIVYHSIQDVYHGRVMVRPSSNTHVRLTLSGTQEEFKAFRKSHHYKSLVDQGVKVVFRPSQLDTTTTNNNNNINTESKLSDILYSLIESDAELVQLYKEFFMGTGTQTMQCKH